MKNEKVIDVLKKNVEEESAFYKVLHSASDEDIYKFSKTVLMAMAFSRTEALNFLYLFFTLDSSKKVKERTAKVIDFVDEYTKEEKMAIRRLIEDEQSAEAYKQILFEVTISLLKKKNIVFNVEKKTELEESFKTNDYYKLPLSFNKENVNREISNCRRIAVDLLDASLSKKWSILKNKRYVKLKKRTYK